MCMAIYKPKGKRLPSKKTLQYIWSKNSDGAGYLVIKGRLCYITKGFLTFKDFWEHLNKNPEVTQKAEVLLHFRFATAGALDATCTHPFPITRDLKKLKTSAIACSQAVIHNGILGEGEENLSDTMVFVRDVLYPLKKYFEDSGIIDLIGTLSDGSRLALVSYGKVILTGKWVENKGVYYSNSAFKKPAYRKEAEYTAYDKNYAVAKGRQGELFKEESFTGDVPFCPSCGFKQHIVVIGYDEFECSECEIAFDIWKEDGVF